MARLTVGLNKQYASLATALEAARDGDVVAVSSGIYIDDIATVRAKVTLLAVGGKVTLLATTPLASGRAILTVTTDVVIDGFVLAGAKAADGTAAGLLDTAGTLVVRNTLFTGNQTGLLVQPATPGTGTVLVQGSEFAGNGAGDGFSGNVVVGAVAALTIQDSFVHDSRGGDEIRSTARATTITGSRILDTTSPAATATATATARDVAPTADINLPKGGAVMLQNNVIEKGPDSTGPAIRIGGDTQHAATSIAITGNTIVADGAAATAAVRNTTTATAAVTGNQVFGFAAVATGPAVLSSGTIPAARPATPATPLVVPSIALPVEYGRAGAVAANGTVLTVGPSGLFPTLAAALATAHDGDTIHVAAGTYAETGLTVAQRVIIEGTGGLARFVAAQSPGNGTAVITTTVDATLRNIEVTGASLLGGVAAGLRSQGGNLTVVNSYIHDNQAGIVAQPGAAATVGLYDTELARNGTVDGAGANLDGGAVGTLTLRNLWIHDAPGGAEVRSTAANTVVAASRVRQTQGSGAYAIDLPNAGQASIAGSVVEKGAGSLGGALIHVGGGTEQTASAVTLAGNTLISGVTAAATRFIVADGTAPVAASGTAFQGGAAGSVQAVGAVNTGAATRTGIAVAATAPWTADPAMTASQPAALTVAAPVLPAAERGVMVVRLSEDAYRGHARFTLTVDGAQVGGTLTAGARHGSGESQSFTIAGDFAPGPHVVGVTLINDLSGPDGTSRNLYVDGLSFNGQGMAQSAALTANGTALLATGRVTRATPVTVNLSEDAWRGDAQALVTIDGQLQGGVVVITASHALGRTQPMSFLPDLSPGAHTVGITYLNDAKDGTGEDRNLYVDSVDVAGAHYAMAAATLGTNGTSTFAFTVPPPPAANAGLFLTAGLPQAMPVLLPAG